MPGLCHTWACEYCAHARARRYIAALLESSPSCKWELTVQQGAVRDSLDDCQRYVDAIPKMMRAIRRDRGDWEYFWTYELHRKGGAHVHGLGRGVVPSKHYIEWQARRAGLGYVCWVRTIDNLAADVCQCAKYLFKAHSRAYQRRLPARRIHRSRKFLDKPLADFDAPDESVYTLETTARANAADVFERLKDDPLLERAFIPRQDGDRFTLDEFERKEGFFELRTTESRLGQRHDTEAYYAPALADPDATDVHAPGPVGSGLGRSRGRAGHVESGQGERQEPAPVHSPPAREPSLFGDDD